MSEMNIRDRVKKTVKVKASSLKNNPWNFRTHNMKQKYLLRDILSEIGFAGAVLVRELEDGTYMLLDGHMRKEELGDQKITAIVTDLTEDEAKKLLAVYDPLSTLAETDKEAFAKLIKDVDTNSVEICSLFSSLSSGAKAAKPDDLELDIEEGEGNVEVDLTVEKEIPPSHVRMCQLFLNVETEPEFEKMIAQAGPHYGTKNATETVLAALRDVTKNMPEPPKREPKEDKPKKKGKKEKKLVAVAPSKNGSDEEE